MKSSRLLGTNPKATTCVYLKTHNTRFSSSIHPLRHTYTNSTAHKPVGLLTENILHTATLNRINKKHDATSHYTSKSVPRAGKLWERIHSGINLHPSERISGRYSWTCWCGLMLIYAYVFALVHFLCICPPMLLFFAPVVTLEWNMDVLPPIWVQRNGFGLGLLCSI